LSQLHTEFGECSGLLTGLSAWNSLPDELRAEFDSAQNCQKVFDLFSGVFVITELWNAAVFTAL